MKNDLHTISRTLFPLMLAYACTIHKVQVLAIPNTVVVLDFKDKNLLIIVNYMLH